MLVTDESPINVPGIAAAHVIKRYTAQAVDEISLEVRFSPILVRNYTSQLNALDLTMSRRPIISYSCR